jgi:hypothetical protein
MGIRLAMAPMKACTCYAGTLDRKEAERREGSLGFRHTGVTTALMHDAEMVQPSAAGR